MLLEIDGYYTTIKTVGYSTIRQYICSNSKIKLTSRTAKIINTKKMSTVVAHGLLLESPC